MNRCSWYAMVRLWYTHGTPSAPCISMITVVVSQVYHGKKFKNILQGKQCCGYLIHATKIPIRQKNVFHGTPLIKNDLKPSDINSLRGVPWVYHGIFIKKGTSPTVPMAWRVYHEAYHETVFHGTPVGKRVLIPVSRFASVFNQMEIQKHEDSVSATQIEVRISDWQKILVITKLIYGPGSLYSILNFVKDEGAQLNRTEKGYFLNPGQISKTDWEDIKQNLLSPFRAEVKAIFRYALRSDEDTLQSRQENKEPAPLTSEWQKVLATAKMFYGSGSLYSMLNFIASEGAAITRSKKSYVLRPGQIPEADWWGIYHSLLSPFRKEIRIVFRYALWQYVAVRSALLGGETIIFCDRRGFLPRKIFDNYVAYSMKELEELVSGDIDPEGLKLIHNAKKRFGGFIESNEH